MADPGALDLETEFGGIDIYLFDQLQRRRLVPPMRTLDAGCGGGRNLVYLFRAGFDVCATDGEPGAVDAVRRMAATLAPSLPSTNFRVEPVERCSFADADFDVVVSSAVLHFPGRHVFDRRELHGQYAEQQSFQYPQRWRRRNLRSRQSGVKLRSHV